MRSPKFLGTVEKTGTTYKVDCAPHVKRNIQNLLCTLDGERVEITIAKPTKKRSNQQNSYLWGVPYALIAEHTGMDADSVHHEMRGMFLKQKGNGPINKVKSTTKLTTAEFNAYVDSIIRWAAEFLGLYIPLPNEEEMWGGLLKK